MFDLTKLSQDEQDDMEDAFSTLACAIKSIENHLENIETNEMNPSPKYIQGKKLIYLYLQEFFDADSVNVSFVEFVRKEYFCGMTMMLDPFDKYQAALMPYLLTAYMYNMLQSKLISTFLNEIDCVSSSPKERATFYTEKVLWGYDFSDCTLLDKLPELKNMGIGNLFRSRDCSIDGETLSRYFQFYFEDDPFSQGNPPQKSLLLRRIPATSNHGAMIFPRFQKPPQQPYRSKKDTRPKLFFPDMYVKYQNQYFLSEIKYCIERFSSIIPRVIKREQENSSINSAHMEPDLIYCSSLFLFLGYKKDPPTTTTTMSNIPRPSEPKIHKPPVLIAQAETHTSWPVTVNLRGMGYLHDSCTLIPILKENDVHMQYLLEMRDKYPPAEDSIFTVEHHDDTTQIRYHMPSNRSTRDYPKCKKEDLLIGRSTLFQMPSRIPLGEAPDSVLDIEDYSDLPWPFNNIIIERRVCCDTVGNLFLPLDKELHGTAGLTIFILYDLPEEALADISAHINLTQNQGPKVFVEISKRGWVSITPIPLEQWNPKDKHPAVGQLQIYFFNQNSLGDSDAIDLESDYFSRCKMVQWSVPFQAMLEGMIPCKDKSSPVVRLIYGVNEETDRAIDRLFNRDCGES